ncbi:hypothetical protein [Aeromonas veronii]|uniref:Uncharacterized protein n=1 Tax=Aeromonas veronii TaxID=654 RepID=A0A4S5CCW3_AERVE|nr:hypothetical protein [Aeromonas veronii]THJ43627.1 hypothetical protein E8Q35_15075 [Aeromonas veronii]
MSTNIVLDKGTTLYHGTRSTFDRPIGSRQGGPSSVPCVWFTSSPSIAQHYIGHQAQSRMCLYDPQCPSALHDPLSFYQIAGVENAPEAMHLCRNHGYTFRLPENIHNPHCIKYMSFYDGRLTEISNHDVINLLVAHYGYDFSTENTFYGYIKGTQIIPFSEARKGSILEAKVSSKLNLYDARLGDDFGYDYNNVELFNRANELGYDGVIINDRVNSDTFNHLEHLGYAIFPSGLDKLSFSSYPTICANFNNYDELINYDRIITKRPSIADLSRLLPAHAPKFPIEECVSSSMDNSSIIDGVIINHELKHEATALTNKSVIELGPKFFEYDEESRRHILVHELCHFISDSFGIQLAFDMSDLGCFGPIEDGVISHGPNGTFTPNECLTESIAIYLDDPEHLAQHYPKAFSYIDSKLRFGELSLQQKREITEYRSELDKLRKHNAEQLEQAMETLLSHNTPDSPFQEQIQQALREIIFDGTVSTATHQLIKTKLTPPQNPDDASQPRSRRIAP